MDEKNLLIEFFTSETWPFHKLSTLSRLDVLKMIDDGLIDGNDRKSFWIHDENKIVGLVRIFDLDDIEDGSPLFDLRIRNACRGKGGGTQAVRWLTDYLFQTWPTLERIAGSTRVDNAAMRAVFRKCGYTKEGHIRRDWRTPQGERLDSILYGIVRSEWEGKGAVKIVWDDFI